MERKSPGTSARDDGGGSTGGGGKKSEDDEDSGRRRNAEDGAEQGASPSPGSAVRGSTGSVGKSGMHLLHRHLHPRQADASYSSSQVEARGDMTSGGDTSTADSDATLSVSSTVTEPNSSAPTTSTNSNTKGRPGQSSSGAAAMPASPAASGSASTGPASTSHRTGSSMITGRPSARNSSSSMVPVTTVTSFVTSSSGRSNGSTTTTTETSTTRLTLDGTVIVLVYPTDSSLTARNSTSYTSSSRVSASSRSNSTIASASRTSSASRTLSSTTLAPSSTDVIVGGGANPTAVPTTSPTSSASSSGGGGLSPTNQRVIGGVIGGLAGLALLLGLMLFMIKRWKKNRVIQERVDAGYGGPPGPEVQRGGPMTQRSSLTPLAAAAGGFFRQSKGSRQSEASETVPEERGFYKVSGRKLPPAIGGPLPSEFRSSRSVAGSSVYPPEEDANWGGPTTPVSSAGPSGGPSRMSGINTSPTSTAAASSIAAMGSAVSPISTTGPLDRGSVPAILMPGTSRIPEERPEEVESRTVTPNTPTPTIRPPSYPRQPSSSGRDGVGRSLPSHDGSRASRFTEDIV